MGEQVCFTIRQRNIMPLNFILSLIAALGGDGNSTTLAFRAKALSDGLTCFRGIADAGCVHLPTVTGGGAESMNNEPFKWVNTMLGNVKNSLRGTYRKLDSQIPSKIFG